MQKVVGSSPISRSIRKPRESGFLRSVGPMAIRLELFAAEHLPAFAALAADPDVLRFTRFPAEPPPDFAERWLAGYEEHRAAGTREAFAIVEDGVFVGFAVAVGIDRTTQTVELGYAVAPQARGRGIASETLRQLSDWALAQGMERLEGCTSATTTMRRSAWPSAPGTCGRASCAPSTSRTGCEPTASSGRDCDPTRDRRRRSGVVPLDALRSDIGQRSLSVSILWIIIVVIVILALLGFVGRGHW